MTVAVLSELRQRVARDRVASVARGVLRRFAPWAVPVLLLIVWQVATASGLVAPRLLPAPTAVAEAFWVSLLNGTLIDHVWASTVRAFTGLALGGSVGLVTGLATGLSRHAETALDSTIQMLRNLPPLAMIPLVILWFGIDEPAKVFLVAFGVMFPVYVNTFHGIRTVDSGLLEMAQVYGLTRREIYWRVVLPGALPSILVGVRFALGFMWVILIVAETISARSGIGYMTMNAREFLQTDVVVLGILLYAALGKLADLATRAIEHVTLPWHPAYHTQRKKA